MTGSMIRLAIVFAGCLALLVGGTVRLMKRRNNGWNFLLTGILGLLWTTFRFIHGSDHDSLTPLTLASLDHFAAMLAGAAIAFGVLLVVHEVRDLKEKRK